MEKKIQVRNNINKNQMKILELRNTTRIKYSLYELNGRIQVTGQITVINRNYHI